LQYDAGDFKQALIILDRDADPAQRVEGLLEIARRQIQAKDRKGARVTLAKSREVAEQCLLEQHRVYLLAMIAGSSADIGDMTTFNATIARAISTIKMIAEVEVRDQSLADIVGIQASTGDTKGALVAASMISDTRLRALAEMKIAIIQRDSGNPKEAKLTEAQALQLVKSMPIEGRGAAYANIARFQAEKGSFSNALKIVKKVGNKRTKEAAYRDIAKFQGEAGYFREAFKTAESIQDMSLWVETVVELARYLIQAGDTENALMITREAAKGAETIADVEARRRALKNIATFQAEAGFFGDALEIAELITSQEEREEAFSNIAKFQAKARHFNEALDTAKRIEEMSSEGWESFPREQALGEIAKLQAEAGEFSEALGTAEGISDVGEQAEALSAIFAAQALAQDWRGAKITAIRVANVAERLDKILAQIKLYEKVAESHGANSRIIYARKTSAQRETLSLLRTITLEGIAKSQAEAGHVTEALEIADWIEDRFVRSLTLQGIAERQVGAGDWEGAANTVSKVLECSKQVSDRVQRAASLAGVGLLFTVYGDLSEAINFAEGIEDSRTKAETLAICAAAAFRSGNRGMGDMLVRNAIKSAEAIDVQYERNIVFDNIADSLVSEPDQEGVQESISRVLKVIKEHNPERTNIHLMLKVGNLARALDEALTIDDPDDRGSALGWIAEFQANAGNFSEALETAERIPSMGKRVRTLADIAEIQAKKGDSDGVRTTAVKALKQAERIGDPKDRSWAFGSVAVCEALAGNFAKATELTEQYERYGESANVDRDVDHNDHNWWLLLESFLVNVLKTRTAPRDNVVLVFYGWDCA
jgi:tetratricopeptide (TPR) repeat protein